MNGIEIMGLLDYFKKKRAVPIQGPEVEKAEAETSVQDDLLSSIRQFRRQQSAVREKFLKENDEKLAPAHQKIARAEKFMNESGLTESFPKVMHHIRHWVSWSQQESFGEYTAFDVSEITGDKNGLNEWDVAFNYNGHHFQFIFKQEKSDYTSNYLDANMSLVYEDEKVLQIECTLNLDQDHKPWSYVSTSHLVIGDWVHSIVEMHELVELYDLKVAREFGESMLEDQAKNLPD